MKQTKNEEKTYEVMSESYVYIFTHNFLFWGYQNCERNSVCN